MNYGQLFYYYFSTVYLNNFRVIVSFVMEKYPNLCLVSFHFLLLKMTYGRLQKQSSIIFSFLYKWNESFFKEIEIEFIVCVLGRGVSLIWFTPMLFTTHAEFSGWTWNDWKYEQTWFNDCLSPNVWFCLFVSIAINRGLFTVRYGWILSQKDTNIEMWTMNIKHIHINPIIWMWYGF